MTIGGVILLLVGIGLVIWHVLAKKKIGALRVARDMTRAQIDETASLLSGELGGGSFKEFVALRGRPECDSPLISPLGERECLYYEMKIIREYEETYREKDSDGHMRTRTRRSSETMSSESNGVAFAIADSTGSTAVAPDGADFEDLVESVDQFEPGDDGMGQLSYGGFSLSFGRLSNNRRTLGFRYKELILPADRELTVIGDASDASGTLRIARGGMRFIISPRTKREMLGAAESTAKWTSIASGIASLAGVVLLVIGLITHK